MSRNRTQASNRGARDYSDVPLPQINRSVFDRSHSHHTTYRETGEIIIADIEELLPGDTIMVQPTVFARTTTLAVPIFSNVFMDVHYFAVPLRLIWDNAEEFFGAEPGGPGTRTDRLTPKIDLRNATTPGGLAPETLYDYMGVPPGVEVADLNLSPHNLYGRAYSLIWNEWFRDAEIDDLAHLDLDDGPDDPADYPLRRRRKQRDRFTSARPWPQKGPDVDIPLGDSAPVVSDGSQFGVYVDGNGSLMSGVSGGNSIVRASGTWPTSGVASWGPQGTASTGLEADLSSASAATVQALRSAIATQHLFEAFSRAGSARYVELNHTVWGVRGSDARLQRPEYIGGATARLYVNPVAHTASFTVTKTGDLGAFGVAAGQGRQFTYSAEEHCVVVATASIRTPYLYSQGISKELMRHDRFSYAWPQFQNVGEQPILKRELFWDGSATDQEVFGYEPRYQEYRERYNQVSGLMRHGAGNLDYWHLGQEFAAHPELNSTFLDENPPFDRVTTLTAAEEPTWKVDFFIREKMIRPLSAMGVPGLARI